MITVKENWNYRFLLRKSTAKAPKTLLLMQRNQLEKFCVQMCPYIWGTISVTMRRQKI